MVSLYGAGGGGERLSWGFFSPEVAISFPRMEPGMSCSGAEAGSDQGDWGRESPFGQIPAGDSNLNWGWGDWITFIQQILKRAGFSYTSQPLSIVLLPSPLSLGILAPGKCWGLLKLNPFVLVGLILIGTISVLVQKTPRKARLDPCSPGLSLPHLSVSAGLIS